MKGGTYAEALKVGFTSEQAVFFGRMSGETREEAIEAIDCKQGALEDAARQEKSRRRWYAVSCYVCLVAGYFIGKSI